MRLELVFDGGGYVDVLLHVFFYKGAAHGLGSFNVRHMVDLVWT